MRIVDLLDAHRIALGARAKDKSSVIDLLVNLQEQSGVLSDVQAYKQAVWDREAQSSTGIEAGIAVPHAKSDSVLRPSLAAAVLQQGVDYGAMDGQPSDLFFLIAAPADGEPVSYTHLDVYKRQEFPLPPA